MQEETTPIFKRLWYDWTQQQPGIEPTNPLGQCWVPPIVAFYDQQGLLRTYSLPGGSIRRPHPGSPWGCKRRGLWSHQYKHLLDGSHFSDVMMAEFAVQFVEDLYSAGATEDLFVTRGLHQEPQPRISMGGHMGVRIESWMFYAVPTSRVVFAAKMSLDVFSFSREQVWTFSVCGD